MSDFTQEKQTEIVRHARDLTAAIMVEEDELSKLKAQRFGACPPPPVHKVLSQPAKIQPVYPNVPKTQYTYTEHVKAYLNENKLRYVFLVGFISLFVIVTVYSYMKKCVALNKELAESPEYLKAVKDAEELAAKQQAEAEEKVRTEQDKIDAKYKEDKEKYDTVTVPEYNQALAVWENNQKRKITIIDNEMQLNKEALSDLYSTTKFISSTYRELWILDWLYEDMSTSDHDIRYSTELLDRERQRDITRQAGQITTRAIDRMNRNMIDGFSAVYGAIEAGNDIQEDMLSSLSKTRRDMNIGNIVGTVQRHNTNKKLDEMLSKKK